MTWYEGVTLAALAFAGGMVWLAFRDWDDDDY